MRQSYYDKLRFDILRTEWSRLNELNAEVRCSVDSDLLSIGSLPQFEFEFDDCATESVDTINQLHQHHQQEQKYSKGATEDVERVDGATQTPALLILYDDPADTPPVTPQLSEESSATDSSPSTPALHCSPSIEIESSGDGDLMSDVTIASPVTRQSPALATLLAAHEEMEELESGAGTDSVPVCETPLICPLPLVEPTLQKGLETAETAPPTPPEKDIAHPVSPTQASFSQLEITETPSKKQLLDTSPTAHNQKAPPSILAEVPSSVDGKEPFAESVKPRRKRLLSKILATQRELQSRDAQSSKRSAQPKTDLSVKTAVKSSKPPSPRSIKSSPVAVRDISEPPSPEGPCPPMNADALLQQALSPPPLTPSREIPNYAQLGIPRSRRDTIITAGARRPTGLKIETDLPRTAGGRNRFKNLMEKFHLSPRAMDGGKMDLVPSPSPSPVASGSRSAPVRSPMRQDLLSPHNKSTECTPSSRSRLQKGTAQLVSPMTISSPTLNDLPSALKFNHLTASERRVVAIYHDQLTKMRQRVESQYKRRPTMAAVQNRMVLASMEAQLEEMAKHVQK